MTYEQYTWLSGCFAIASFVFLAAAAILFIIFILQPSKGQSQSQNLLWTISLLCAFIGILLGATSQCFENKKFEIEMLRKISQVITSPHHLASLQNTLPNGLGGITPGSTPG